MKNEFVLVGAGCKENEYAITHYASNQLVWFWNAYIMELLRSYSQTGDFSAEFNEIKCMWKIK